MSLTTIYHMVNAGIAGASAGAVLGLQPEGIFVLAAFNALLTLMGEPPQC